MSTDYPGTERSDRKFMNAATEKISVWKKMGESILSNDGYILGFAVFTIALTVVVMAFAWQVSKQVEDHRAETSKSFVYLTEWFSISYNLFTTMITAFPLLGMFGTVSALIGVNLNGGDYQTNFFGALTSTAWGIVFALIFKTVNAVIEHYVLSIIDAAEEIIEKEKEKASQEKGQRYEA